MAGNQISKTTCGSIALKAKSRLAHLGLLPVFFISLFFAYSAFSADLISPDLIRRVDLEWESEGGAIAYDVELATTPDFSNILHSKRTTETKFTVDLLPGAYYYRVRGIDRRNRPGKWTSTQELFLNARPPVLISPENGANIQGNLPDTGLPMKWRSSGPGVRSLIEIKAADPLGNYTNTIVKQEIDGTEYAFFPQEVGKYQWSVHTLGPSGDEPGVPWEFNVEGVFPRLVAPGTIPKRIVRYVSPWWRNHWFLITRYGQASTDYTIIDQDLRGTGHFTGLTGYIIETVNWEWHDPVSWTKNGIPWFELEFELDRITVLGESVVLPRESVRIGAWYDEWLMDWRFSPVLEGGVRDIPIYQPRSSVEAARSTSTRNHIGLGPAAEYKLRPFLIMNAQLKINYEWGGLAGLITQNGDQFDINQRAGNLNSAIGFDGLLGGTMILSPRLKIQARLRYEQVTETWVPKLPPQPTPGVPGGNTQFTFKNVTFDVGLGLKF